MEWLNSFDINAFFNILEKVLVSCGTIFAFFYSFSKKFRNWINDKIKDTESIKQLYEKIDKLSEKVDIINKKFEKENIVVSTIDDKLKINNDTTILTVKYEILDICNRAHKYNGITEIDKKLLCELYHQYVDVWHENHYIKSTALKVIEEMPIIDKYRLNEGQM